MSVEWDPLDPAFKVDPYRTYCSLLQEQPLYKSRYGPLLVLRYEDCVTMLRHPAASNDVFRKTPGLVAAARRPARDIHIEHR